MFTFELRLRDGSVAEPGTFTTAVPSWSEGDTFLVPPGRVYRIVEVEARPDGTTTWVVELE